MVSLFSQTTMPFCNSTDKHKFTYHNIILSQIVLYVFFPVAMFAYFNMPESYEDFMSLKKVCIFCFYIIIFLLEGWGALHDEKSPSKWLHKNQQLLMYSTQIHVSPGNFPDSSQHHHHHHHQVEEVPHTPLIRSSHPFLSFIAVSSSLRRHSVSSTLNTYKCFKV